MQADRQPVHLRAAAPAVVLLSALVVLVGCSLVWLGLAPGVGQEESAFAEVTATSAAAAPAADTLAAHGGQSDTVERVDVVIYGCTTSGLGALRGLKLAAQGVDGPIRVALISNTSAVESPLAQGLCLEDDYHPETVGGFYGEFRRQVLAHYQTQGVWPLERSGRLIYEPEVAEEVLQELAFSEYLLPEAARDKVDVIRLWGVLCTARDEDDDRYLILRDEAGMRHRLETTYFIDASVEADLARALGCSYTIGRHPLRYNDVRGPRPDAPSRTNLYTTSPQSLALLVTLSVSGQGAAEKVSDHALWSDAPSALPTTVPQDIAATFLESWSMRHALPNNKRELNEFWSDCSDCDLAFSWYLQAERRPSIVTLLQQRALSQVAQIQAVFPSLGVARLPTWPYVRGEIMVLGEEVFDLEGLRQGRDDPIACGKYAVFDRHDTTSGAQQSPATATVVLPYAAIKPQGHPYLLVSTAYSVDWRAYNSALRMEPVRANAGAACGALTTLALTAGSPYTDVGYAALRDELEAQGHVLVR